MKLAVLIILSVSLSACKVTESVDAADLHKHLQFSQCVAGCYEKVYGPAAINRAAIE